MTRQEETLLSRIQSSLAMLEEESILFRERVSSKLRQVSRELSKRNEEFQTISEKYTELQKEFSERERGLKESIMELGRQLQQADNRTETLKAENLRLARQCASLQSSLQAGNEAISENERLEKELAKLRQARKDEAEEVREILAEMKPILGEIDNG